MKICVNGIIIVEGKEDVSYLSSFVDSYFVTTNGLDVPKKELEFLKEASNKMNIYVLTDPDDAGECIRKRINSSLNNVINLYVNKDMCDRNNKHGVAECNKNEILSVLEPFSSKTQLFSKSITTEFVYSNNLNNRAIRAYLSGLFKLGIVNNSTRLIERLNVLGISEEEILESLKDY